MDTSETYTKMRLKAIPDLGLGRPPEQSPIKIDGGEIKRIKNWIMPSVFIDITGNFYYSDKDTVCQFERQDQLQEMMFSHWNLRDTLRLINEFSRWLDTTGIGKYENLSMEQLWLAFVMSNLYSKKWDGEDWVTVSV